MPKNGGFFLFSTLGGSPNKDWEAVLPNLLLDPTPEVGVYGGGYYHSYRENSTSGRPWKVKGLASPTPHAPPTPPTPLHETDVPQNFFCFGSGFPDGVSPVNPVTAVPGMFQSSYDGGSRLEAIVRYGTKLYHFWRDPGNNPAAEPPYNFRWHGPLQLRNWFAPR